MESQLLEWLSSNGLSGLNILQVLFALMVAVLFIQSGLDKVFNWKGEKDYYVDHFKNSPLKGSISILMPIITISELSAGFFSLIGIFEIVVYGKIDFALLGMFFGCLSIVQLFFGQRLAKDYAGAASLVPYFLLTGFGLLLFVLGAN